MVILLALGAGLAGLRPARAEFELVPLLDASLAITGGRFASTDAGTVVDLQGNTIPPVQTSSSGDVYVSAAPNFRFTEVPGLWITPAVEFEYSGANNLLSIDDETFLFAKRLDLYYLIGANYALDRTWSAKLKAFGRLENVAEAADEDLLTGLYDYRDVGGWGEGSSVYSLGTPMRTRLGYKYYQRRYPNYSNAPFVAQYEQTVGPWPAELPRDLREKDMNVSEAWLRQEVSWGDLPVLTNLEVRGRFLDYTQMPVIIEDGTFSSDLRRDTYLDLSLEVPWLLNKYHQLELDYGYRLRISKQNFYDMAQDPVTGENTFLGGYYNYRQNSVRLLYNFTLDWDLAGFPAKGALTLGWTNRLYLSRPPRQKTSSTDEIGAYNFGGRHSESTLDAALTFRQALWASWFNLFVSFHLISQSSNTNVSDAASYNYQYHTITAGTGLSF